MLLEKRKKEFINVFALSIHNYSDYVSHIK